MKSILARSMKRRFLDIGEETDRTQLFESLSEAKRAELSARLALDPDEESTLVAALSPEGCLLLSMKRAIVELPTGLQSLPYSTIERVTVDRDAEFKQWRGKRQWRTLRIDLTSGEQLSVEMEPGKAFWGFYNAFKFQSERHT